MDSVSLATLLQGLHDLNLLRYLSGAGMALLIYDHLLTFADEVNLVWKARLSLAKILFLLNRYSALIGHLNVAFVTNNYYTSSLSDSTCEGVFAATVIELLLSFGCANVLVLLRVLNLWDYNRRVTIAMGLVFFACYSAALTCLIFYIVNSFESFRYVPIVHSCAGVIDSPLLKCLWVSQVAFESFILVCVVLNALSRPRKDGTPLERMLIRDGILVFGAFACLQTVNLIASFATRSSLRTIFILPVWSLTTLILNRSLLRLHRESSSSAPTHARLRDTSDDSSTQAFVRSESYLTDFGPLPFPEEKLGRVHVIKPAPLGTFRSDATRSKRSVATVPSEAAYADRIAANKRALAYHTSEPARTKGGELSIDERDPRRECASHQGVTRNDSPKSPQLDYFFVP